MNSYFDKKLEKLNTKMMELANLSEESMNCIILGLDHVDDELIKKVNLNYSEMVIYQEKIEKMCLRLLLQYQPVAKDLRLISSSLKMVTDMRKIGDLSVEIMSLMETMKGNIRYKRDKTLIKEMATHTRNMATLAVNAFIEKDSEMAEEVMRIDNSVDNLFIKVKNEVINFLINNVEENEVAINLLLIAKHLERIGDYSVNVAKWVIYSVKGEYETV